MSYHQLPGENLKPCVSEAYFKQVTMRYLAMGAGICLLGVVLLGWVLFPKKPHLTTLTVMNDIGIGYENYLVDDQADFEFASPAEFLSHMSHNPRGILYFDLPKDFRGRDGSVIDTWGRPLQIKRLEERKVEIRSAGSDGKFGSLDDIMAVYPERRSNDQS